jgi:hypothetical protein
MTPRLRTVLGLLFLFVNAGGTKEAKAQISGAQKTGSIAGSFSIEGRSWLTEYHEFKFARIDFIDPETGVVYDSLIRSRSIRRAHYGQLYGDMRLVGYLKDFKEGKKWVFLYQRALPVGKYCFYQLEVASTSPEIQPSQYLRINIPFTVEKDKTTYIGEMNFNGKSQQLQLINRIEMDRGALQKKYPGLIIPED